MTLTPTTAKFFGGGQIDFLNPVPSDIDFGFIAARLSSMRRFTGHARALVVSAHSWMVAEAMRVDGHPPALQLVGLLHDAHEAFTGDFSSPLRRALSQLAGKDVVTAIQHRIDGAIFESAGVPTVVILDAQTELTVRRYDLRARVNELRDYMGEDPAAWNCPGEPLPVPSCAFDDPAFMFLTRLKTLQTELGVHER